MDQEMVLTPVGLAEGEGDAGVREDQEWEEVEELTQLDTLAEEGRGQVPAPAAVICMCGQLSEKVHTTRKSSMKRTKITDKHV